MKKECNQWVKRLLAVLLAITMAMQTVVSAAAEPIKAAETERAETQETTTLEDAGVELSRKDFSTDFKVIQKWEGQFQGEITIINHSEKTIENWSISCKFEHEITEIWNAFIYDHEGDIYQFKNAEWNSDIAPGASVSFAFTADWDNETIKKPSEFELISEKVTMDGDSYKAEFTVTSDWGDGFTASIMLINDTEKVIEDWVLSFDFDYEIDNIWNAKIIEHNENHYIIQNAGYNARLKKGEKIEVGFQGKPGNVQNGPYNYELMSYETLKPEMNLAAPKLVLDGTGEYPVLRWNKVEGAATYTVQRKSGTDGKYSVLAADLTDTAYTDMTADKSGEYYYVVTAENKYAQSPFSNEECYCSVAKAPVLNGKMENGAAKLIWDKTPGARSYTLYRGTKSGGPYYVIADRLLKTEYIDKDMNPDEIYYYVVTAVNERGNSNYSNEIKLSVNGEMEYTFDGEKDDDGDGLANGEELLYGTDIFSKDTDNDGLDDAEEVRLGTNPLEPDTDGDGIYDGAEVLLGLDPFKTDKMGEYQISKKSGSGRAKIEISGNSNLVIAPVTINDSENIFINSLDGIVGNAVDITTGGFPLRTGEVVFNYTEEELATLGTNEDELSVYRINYDSKKLEKLEEVTCSKEEKTVTGKILEGGTYLLGPAQMVTDLSNVDIVFAIDQSGSMSWNDPKHYRLLATRKFLRKLDMDSYHAGILGFEDRAKVNCEITGNRGLLDAAIGRMEYFGGGTNLYYAIVDSVGMFKDDSRRKVVILLTDGRGGNPVPNATDLCNEKNVVVNTIALGSDTDTRILENIATCTKGGYFYINNSGSMTREDVEKQIDIIYEKLSKQLTLSEKAEDEDLPKSRMNLEFSDLYFGIDSKEAQEWITTASTNLLTGNYVYSKTDLSLEGPGNNLEFTRTYNSLSGNESSILGKGYHTSLDMEVEKKDSSSGEQVQTGRVDVSRLNVREDAGTDKRIIGGISRGTLVKVLGTKEISGRLWYKIKYKEKDGYIAGWYIDGSGGYEVSFESGTKIFFTENSDGSIRSNNSTDVIFSKTSSGYSIKNKDQSKTEFDKKGKLTGMYDRYGNKISVTYSDGKISRLTDAVGRFLKFTYNGSGLLKTVEDSSGRSVSYEYNSKKQLTSVTDVMGNKTTFEYHKDSGLLSSVDDPLKHQVVRNDYDVLGRVVRQYDGDNIIQYFIYDDETDNKSEGVSARYMINGNGKESKTTFSQDLKPVIERDALGGQTQYKYEYYNSDSNKWVDITSKRDGDAAWDTYEDYRRTHRVAVRETVTDKNKFKTVTEYDKHGNPVKITDPMKNTVSMKYDKYGNLVSETDKAGNRKTHTYDDNGIKLLEETDELGNVTEYKYYAVNDDIKIRGLVKTKTDQRGAVTTYYYTDSHNNCTKVKDALGNITKTSYDKTGKKLSETDALGNTAEYTYDKAGQLVKETDALGNSIKFTYDAVGNKTSETDKRGNVTKYKYDAKNQLTKITDALGNTTEYTYDHVGNVLKEITAKGTTCFEYDAVNNKIGQKNALKEKTAFAYDKNGNLTVVTDAQGKKTEYTYDSLNRKTREQAELGHIIKYVYDVLGNLMKETDGLGNSETTEYDALGRIVKKVDKDGNATVTKYDDEEGTVTVTAADGGVTITETDLLSRESSVTDALGNTIKKAYDKNGNLVRETDVLGRVTVFEYDELNRRISMNLKYKEDGETKDCIISYAYDKNGNKTKETDAKGQTTKWKYDALNRVIKETSAEGGERTCVYDEAGNVIKAEDELGRTITKKYDVLSRLTEEKDALGAVTSYSYDSVGNLIAKEDANGGKTTYAYDILDRLIVIKDAHGNGAALSYDKAGNNTAKMDRNGNITFFGYDKSGHMISSKDPYGNCISYQYDSMGRQTKVTDAMGGETVTKYDKLGRKISITDQTGNTKKYKYDANGNLKQETDSNGNITRYCYDDFDQLVKVTDAEGCDTVYSYDLAGNLTGQTDGEGHKVSYSYDSMNRRSSMQDGAGKKEIYVYDKASNLVSKTDRNGVVTEYTYDENNQLLTEKAGKISYSYSYDALGNMLSMEDSTGVTEYSYDKLSRLTKMVTSADQTVSYTYDAVGNRLTVQSGVNKITKYEYDRMNRISKVKYGRNDTCYEYDANGNQIKMVHSNGMKTSYTFDGRNLLTGIVNTNPDGTRKEYYYNYDPEGLLTEKQEPKGKTTYTYNKNNQLVSMTEPDQRETVYTYDRAGNRSSQKVKDGSSITEISYTYDSRNRLTATAEKKTGTTVSTVYSYDANGNQTSVVAKDSAAGTSRTDKYTYDELNQLTHIKGSDGSSTDYTYYATGLRASKNVNGSTAVFTYDGTELLTEQSGDAVKTNIYGTNLIATDGTDMLYYQYNSHGDVVSVLNRTGAVKNEYDYDAFGNAITEKETVSNPYRYAGYYQDAETGLYYLKSRYYNPRTARFLTEDTASGTYTDPLSLNRYTYCHNQPVTGYDPDGHFLHIVAGAVIGAVVNSAVSAYTQYKNTGKVDPRTTLGAAAEGAIVGGTAAATCGTSLGVTVVAGATASAAGNAANQYISTGAVDVSQMMLSAVGGAAAFGTANLAGSLLKAGSSAAAQASAKATGSAGMQAAAKAGGSALGKMVSASAAGGITGMAAGVSADLAVQTTEILSGMSDGYDLERTKNSALLGGAVGAGLGAASQTPLVQKAGAKFHAWDAVLKEKTGNIGEGFQASMADNRGFADFDALSGKKTSGGVYGESGTSPSKYQKASLWERLTTRKADVNDLYANPLDEFSNPRIGPSDSAVAKYIKEINTTDRLSTPIEVQKLSTDGYEIVNGHHRWLAAQKAGLERVPIQIKNYNNYR